MEQDFRRFSNESDGKSSARLLFIAYHQRDLVDRGIDVGCNCTRRMFTRYVMRRGEEGGVK